MSAFDRIAYILTIIGGVNWGLVGLFEFNLVDALFGEASVLSRIVYILVGLAATYLIYTASKVSRHHTAGAM